MKIEDIVFGFFYAGNAIVALYYRFNEKNQDVPKACFAALCSIVVWLAWKAG